MGKVIYTIYKNTNYKATTENIDYWMKSVLGKNFIHYHISFCLAIFLTPQPYSQTQYKVVFFGEYPLV